MGLFIFRNSTLLFTSLVLETPTHQGMELPFIETWETHFHEVYMKCLHPPSQMYILPNKNRLKVI